MRIKTYGAPLAALLVVAALAWASVAGAAGTTESGSDLLINTPVGGALQLDNACYVRLPDLPKAGYGGFGGYNQETGVLFYAGGAEKRTEENTIALHDLYAIPLDGTADKWATIPYPVGVGYARDFDKGCREMASVQIAPGRWVSVGGKDGCDGDASRKGGDIKDLTVGASADPAGVRWLPGSGADIGSLPPELAANKFKLARLFATWDTQRQRIVFGQGTFDDERDQLTQDEVYQAVQTGSVWKVTELRPSGHVPSRRFGACAAYVYDKDTGVDGVLVLGGQQGGVSGTTSYKEVWWLDYSESRHGEWSEITSRFGNMDDFGYRREGACAYNPDTKVFYSWMGRADATIPDGASRSSGAWMVDLSTLADESASLSWVRIAKDKADEPSGRRLIPSVYDPVHNRFFAIGGRNSLAEYADVWAIYPGITGDACTNLDPYAPFRPAPTATPDVPPTAPEECAFLVDRVPAQVRSDALANPASVYGYQMLCNPNVPAGPYNGMRDRLSLRAPSQPYHPLYNALIWSCGCP